jgi:positive regulator of sigma E activity
MLPVLGIIFGLFVAFIAAQVWADNDRATATVSQEAGALRSPRLLSDALQFVLSLAADGPGQQTAQHEIINAVERALEARRQRIIISLAEVDLVKWVCLYLQAMSVLLAIAIVHHEDRGASLIALALFATGVAASVLLIAAHDRPFIGQLSVKPDLLQQIMPGAPGR